MPPARNPARYDSCAEACTHPPTHPPARPPAHAPNPTHPPTLSVASTELCTCGLVRHFPCASPCQGDPSQLQAQHGGGGGRRHASDVAAAEALGWQRRVDRGSSSQQGWLCVQLAHLIVGPTSLMWSLSLLNSRSCQRVAPCTQEQQAGNAGGSLACVWRGVASQHPSPVHWKTPSAVANPLPANTHMH